MEVIEFMDDAADVMCVDNLINLTFISITLTLSLQLVGGRFYIFYCKSFFSAGCSDYFSKFNRVPEIKINSANVYRANSSETRV